MIFSNRYAREAAGFSAGKVSRIEKGVSGGRCGLLQWPCQPDERLDVIGAMDGPYMQMNVK
jgi:hypothetical protein